MDNHPIPQDVTGFQFKLIGNMTVKQFAYVAVGVVSSVIIFYMKFLGPLRFLLLLIPSGLGVGLAFLPIEGRPMDVMLGNFLRALFAPNQYLFTKVGGHLAFATANFTPKQVAAATIQAQQEHITQDAAKQQKLQAYLQQMQGSSQNELDVKENQALQSLSSLTGPAPQAAGAPVPQQVQPMQSAVSQPQQEAPQPLTAPTQKSAAVDTEVANILSQKEQLKDEMSHLKQDLFQAHTQSTPAAQPPLQPTPSLPAQNLPQSPMPVIPNAQQGTSTTTQTVTQTTTTTQSQQTAKTPFISMTKPIAGTNRPAGIVQKNFSTPAAPNIIIGNVRDSRGNALTNMLVEIKDKEGNPIRAFKTNVVGQFASATPLQNGSYTIIIEDPKSQHSFQPIPIEANGSMIPTLEIISVDAREALRRELFTA